MYRLDVWATFDDGISDFVEKQGVMHDSALESTNAIRAALEYVADKIAFIVISSKRLLGCFERLKRFARFAVRKSILDGDFHCVQIRLLSI